jgi:hypothetical protein
MPTFTRASFRVSPKKNINANTVVPITMRRFDMLPVWTGVRTLGTPLLTLDGRSGVRVYGAKICVY